MNDQELGGHEPPFDAPPDKESHRRRTLGLGAGAAVILALVAGVLLWPRAETAAPPTTTTTTTTTVVEPPETIPPGTFEIATAKASVSVLKVLANEPAGWATQAVVESDPPEAPPSSQETVPERVSLPSLDAPIVGRTSTLDGWEFANPGPYDPPQPFTMLVTERRDDWVKVAVPVRPNGTEGWVKRSEVDLSSTTYRIEIRVGERMLRTYQGNDVIAETAVVVGAPGTETPTGRFYMTDVVPQKSQTYGPFALATDGYSETIDVFDTGVPVVALHGTNRPELIGQARSNGCVRLPNEVIEKLATQLPQGTPIDIFP